MNKVNTMYLFLAAVLGYTISFLSVQSEIGPLFIFCYWPFFFIIQKCKSLKEFFCIVLVFLTGSFFCLFEGLAFFNAGFFEINLIGAFLIHMISSVLFQLPMAAVLSLSYKIKEKHGLNEKSFLIIFVFFLYFARHVAQIMFPASPLMLVGLSDNSFKQLYSIFGIDFFESIFLFVNILLYFSFVNFYEKSFKRAISTAIVFILAVSCLYVLSKYEEKKWSVGKSKIQFAYYQPGFVRKSDLSTEEDLLGEKEDINTLSGNLERIKDQEEGKIDFVVLPEAYFDSYINEPLENTLSLKKVVKTNGIPLISGGQTSYKKGLQKYNSLFYLNELGELDQQYFKVDLMPVGERKLFSDVLPFLREYLPGDDHYIKGPSKKNSVKTIKDLRIGFAICYEDIWKDTYKVFTDELADLIISVSSDNLLRVESFAKIHHAGAVANAISVRRPLIRLTNTGISSAVRTDGVVTILAGHKEAKFGVQELNLGSKKSSTIFTRFGKYFMLLFFILTLILILIIEIKGPNTKD